MNVHFGFPLFAGVYLGREPGGSVGNVARTDWQLFVAPTYAREVSGWSVGASAILAFQSF